MPSLHELVFLIIIIILLNLSGFWPAVVRGLRELRGEHVDAEAPPSPPAAREDLDLSFKLLGLSPSSPWDAIERAYRAKAKIHHPDIGGDDDTMRALNDAYARIKRARGK